MQDVDGIFKALSVENKALKPGYAYKTGQEGLLRAFYFFRWCNKNGFETLDKVVEQFIKKKIPEQQVEHFAVAMVMIDQYDTDPEVKDAIRGIDAEITSRSGGVSLIEALGNSKAERRILKNTLTTYREALDGLKKRAVSVKNGFIFIWVAIALLLAADAFLAATGKYGLILAKAAPSLAGGVSIVAAIIFIAPAALILFFNRHILSEQVRCGGVYPKDVLALEKGIRDFEEKLREKKINL